MSNHRQSDKSHKKMMKRERRKRHPREVTPTIYNFTTIKISPVAHKTDDIIEPQLQKYCYHGKDDKLLQAASRRIREIKLSPPDVRPWAGHQDLRVSPGLLSHLFDFIKPISLHYLFPIPKREVVMVVTVAA